MMKYKLLLSCCLSVLASALTSQNMSFVASTNAKQVTSQSIFQVTFTLQNAQGKDFQPPDFKGFDYISGPSQSRSTSIINGVMTQSMSYSYALMRIRPGKYTIGPASIKVGSKTLTTEPVTIEVVQGRATPDNTGPAEEHDVFLKATVSSKEVYPGQQVILDYKVYTTVSVRNYNTLSEDDYAQFYYRYVQDFNNRAQLEVIDGVQYTVQKIKSIALFPQQSGTARIAPMVASFGIAVKDERPSFLFGTRTTPVTVASDSVALKVLPLPDSAPVTFTGAVGRYAMQASVSTDRLTTDDAVALTLDITGDGDPRRWSPPDLNALQSEYELYDPKVLIDEAVDQRGTIRHRRMIEYVLVPRSAGEKTLHVEFSYFDPDSASYRTLSSTTFRLSVGQGTHAAGSERILSTDTGEKELRGLKPMLAGTKGVFLFTPVYLALLVLPVIALAILWWQRRKEDLFESLDPAEKKKRRARKLAERHLTEAQQYLSGSDRPFFDAISRTLFSYLSAKLKIPTSEISKANIAAHLSAIRLPQELRDEVMSILVTCEQVLYAGGSTDADKKIMYTRTLELISQIEECK